MVFQELLKLFETYLFSTFYENTISLPGHLEEIDYVQNYLYEKFFFPFSLIVKDGS